MNLNYLNKTYTYVKKIKKFYLVNKIYKFYHLRKKKEMLLIPLNILWT